MNLFSARLLRVSGLIVLLVAALFPGGAPALAAPQAAATASIVSEPWLERDDNVPAQDDASDTFNLPFTFPYFGRDIERIDVNTNGLIELLEAGESCFECGDYETYVDGAHIGTIDAIFSANDDLETSIIINREADRVTITWIGTHHDDFDFEDKPTSMQVILYPDGRIVWKFYDLTFPPGETFSGLYDNEGAKEYEVPGGSTSIFGRGVRKAFQYTPGDAKIQEIPWDPNDRVHDDERDDDFAAFSLPFTFPFFERDVTSISVNTNGLIELLEAGESCAECDDYETHSDGDHIALNIDSIFAANDDLITGFIVNMRADQVIITWIGSTYSDDDFVSYPTAFQVILYPDGSVVWKFYDMNFSSYDGDMFSGVYDEVADREYKIPGGGVFDFIANEVHKAFRFTPGEDAGETGARQKTGVDGGTHRFGDVIVIIPPFAIPAGPAANTNTCDLIVTEIAEDNGAFGFTNGEPVFDIKIICGDKVVNILNLPITVCLRGNGNAVFHRHGNKGADFNALPVVAGPDGYVCGTTSLLSAFTLGRAELPATGFAPGQVTALGEQPAALAYAETGMTLDIPKLGVTLDIVGVPQTPGGWDVTWLAGQAGYLNGTAFPTWAGNSVITAHVWDANNNPGPFAALADLQHGDQFTITAFGQTYVYEVRDNQQVRANNQSVLAESPYSTITLLTCEGFNAVTGEYAYRRAVTAVLVEIR